VGPIRNPQSAIRNILVAPSLLAADFARLKDEIQAVEAAGADSLHVDVMDGHFVPNLTVGPFIVEAIRRVSRLPLDCHLMIENPARYVEAFVKAGAAWVSVHPEAAGDIHAALDLVRKAGAHPALALKPLTPVAAAEPFAAEIEMLLIMTVDPGFGGQKLMTECLPKFGEARRRFGPDLWLEVDGGITLANVAGVRDAGAQVLVAGTAVFKSGAYPQAIRALRG
jgi:ribulose-phosphate 3-epimerase